MVPQPIPYHSSGSVIPCKQNMFLGKPNQFHYFKFSFYSLCFPLSLFHFKEQLVGRSEGVRNMVLINGNECPEKKKFDRIFGCGGNREKKKQKRQEKKERNRLMNYKKYTNL
ncbi:unnamed protein product [Brassica oleracea var. botrytis]